VASGNVGAARVNEQMEYVGKTDRSGCGCSAPAANKAVAAAGGTLNTSLSAQSSFSRSFSSSSFPLATATWRDPVIRRRYSSRIALFCWGQQQLQRAHVNTHTHTSRSTAARRRRCSRPQSTAISSSVRSAKSDSAYASASKSDDPNGSSDGTPAICPLHSRPPAQTDVAAYDELPF
jgi:hypothetical protein